MLWTTHAPPRGTVLAGKYRVERVIGHGGMGLVLAAMHLQLDHLVAIKLLLPDLARDLELLARFLREGRAAVKIRSEHVARVLDVGTLDDGVPYMVLEYLEGRDLGDLLAAKGPLPIARVVDLVLQACEALAEAHDLGIVHRDLKPSNFFLTARRDETDCIKLLDFGISKVTESTGPLADAARTDTRSTLGSPAYMSPEQLKNARDVDLRTDIWSLGISLHELITGELPFTGNSVAELTGAALHVPATPLRAKRPDAPAALEAVVLQCLAKERAERFPTIAALASALAPFGSASARASAERIGKIQRGSQKALPDDAPPRAITTSSAESDAETVVYARTDTAWNRSTRTATPKRVIVPAIVVVLVGAIGAGVLWKRRPARSPAPEVSAVSAEAATPVAETLPPASASTAPALSASTAPSSSASSAAPLVSVRARPEPTKRPPRPPAGPGKPPSGENVIPKPPVTVAPGMATTRDGT